MGFFGKKKIKEETIPEKSEEAILKEELEVQVESLQNEFRTKQEELDKIKQKIHTVKEEYDTTVSNLMSIKKEFNQKNMELDIIQREYREVQKKIKNTKQDSQTIKEFNKTGEDLLKTKQQLDGIKKELESVKKEHEKIKEESTKEQSILHNIRKQQIDAEKELDEANSRLYNAKEELDKKDNFQDTNILTSKEKEFIQGDRVNEKTSAGIIEAASAVVGSLKSKLNMTQKELETVQLLLEKEREKHVKTKQELEKLQTSTKTLEKL